DVPNGERPPELLQRCRTDLHAAHLTTSLTRGIHRPARQADACSTCSHPSSAPAAMEIGTVVTHRGRAWYVRGFDPYGVTPQYVYREHVQTGRTVSVLRTRLASHSRARRGASPIRLVDNEPDSADES